MLVDLGKLRDAYASLMPDVNDGAASFGTSGHRGSSLRGSFNEGHVLAISQAICDPAAGDQRRSSSDTHALSEPAFGTALCANGVETMVDQAGGLYPHAGDLPCDSLPQPWPRQRPGRWHRHHPFAQSAGGWRLQVQPAPWRTG
jgi:hypothetical protein